MIGGGIEGLRRYRRRKFAELYDRAMKGYERWIDKRRVAVVEQVGAARGAGGEVLELGPGTGANLPLLGAGTRWVGVEPNEFFHPGLRARAAEHGVVAEVLGGDAASIARPDASAGVVLVTLVLCSVPDLAAALAEIWRVLEPGGRLVFLEHVGAPAWSARRGMQRVVAPFHALVADGCWPCVDAVAAMQAAGFEVRVDEEFSAPFPDFPPWIAPHVRGEAVKPLP